MKKTTIPIKGMHCRSCEILIEERLKELPEIKNVQVSYKKCEANIYSKYQLEMSRIRSAVELAGYKVGVDDSKSWISLNRSEYLDLAVSFVLLLVLFFAAKKFGFFDINTSSAGNPSNLMVVLLVGLTAGLSTCMALVGGLVLGISARHSEKHPDATPVQKFRPHLFFNAGRILSFFILGGIIGLAGKVFQLSGPALGLLTIIVGIVMIILGAQLTGMFPRLSNGGLTLPSSVSKILGTRKRHEKGYSHFNSIFVGALTFFLPCGFTQAMQLYAMSTGNFWSGAMIMGVFAIGTAPGLLGIGGLTSFLKGAFAKKFFKFVGLLVIALAVFNISNGYNLTGWNLFSAGDNQNSPQVEEDPNVKLENGIQVVRMDQLAGAYKPNKFTIKKGVPVKWIINAKKPDSCSGSIMASKIGLKKTLKLGENIVEFTPQEVGEIKFSCLMGMYTGKFIVVENDGPQKTEEDALSAPQSSQSPQAPQSSQASPASSIGIKPQVIKTEFNEVSWEATTDISPNEFTVTAGKPVRFEIKANVDGFGCMSTIMIPGIIDEPVLLEKDKTIVWEFTPEKGTYNITCAMGAPRGKITAV